MESLSFLSRLGHSRNAHKLVNCIANVYNLGNYDLTSQHPSSPKMLIDLINF